MITLQLKTDKMAEELLISKEADKETVYKELLPQISSLIEGETDMVANVANTVAALHQTFGWLWTGFYFVKDNELVLGPFQGPIACTRIKYGRGVCGTAWKEKRSLLVPDVEKFPGHISCSSLSVSEIVIPIFDATGKVFGILDIDSPEYDIFDEIDVKYLEEIGKLITSKL